MTKRSARYFKRKKSDKLKSYKWFDYEQYNFLNQFEKRLGGLSAFINNSSSQEFKIISL